MQVHLVDGTYELFRYFYGMPSHLDADGRDIGATRGVLGTVVAMLESGATHIGVATDHRIESFRNDLWAGYKTGAGIDPALLGQFELVEEAISALGVALWPMIDFEADDALASAARAVRDHDGVDQVIICTPDKDLAQCVRGTRVIQRHRRTNVDVDEDEVRRHFGVAPESIPDWLALVGDSADGFPGLAGWGKRSAAVVLSSYGHLVEIPDDVNAWDAELRANVRGAGALAQRLRDSRELVMLFLQLATLREDAIVLGSPDELAWRGPRPEFDEFCQRIDASYLVKRVAALIPHS